MNNTVEHRKNNDFKVLPTMSESAKKFFALPSKLSTGEKNSRFKGTVRSMFHLSACSEQAGN